MTTPYIFEVEDVGIHTYVHIHAYVYICI